MRLSSPVFALLGLVTVASLSGCGGGSKTVIEPSLNTLPLVPACANPVPLEGFADNRPARRYFVTFPSGTNAAVQTAALAAKYDFLASVILNDSFNGFGAALTPEQVAALRCEPIVSRIAYDGVGGGTGG